MIKKILFFISLFSLSITSSAQQWKWAVRGGGSSFDYTWDVATDSKKNAYMVGSFQGTCTIGTNTINTSNKEWAFVAKYDSLGVFKWVRTIANTNYNSYTYGIAIDKDDRIYVTGQYQGAITVAPGFSLTSISNQISIFFIRYDTSGNPVWAKTAGPTNLPYTVGSLATDNKGYIYLSGSLYTNSTTPSPATFGTSQYIFNGKNMFLAKSDSLGNFIWVKSSSGSISNGVTGNNISVSKNNIYVTGSIYGSATFGNTLAGDPSHFNIYAASYDLNGNFKWVKTYRGGMTSGNDSYDISADTLNNVFLSGKIKGSMLFAPGDSLTSNSNTFDALLMALDSLGNTKWKALTGSSGDDQCRAVVVDNMGSAYYGGSLTGTQNFLGINITTFGSTTDIFVAKVSSTGNLKWVKTGGGNGTDYLLALTKDKNKNTVHAGGYFNSTSATYGSSTIIPKSNYDAMLIQLADTMFDVSHVTVNIVCKNACMGSAMFFVNGTAPYQYSWSTGLSGPFHDSLCAGNYTVTATDANNRSKTIVFSVSALDSLTANINTQIDCNKDSFLISVNPMYGSSPYSFQYNSVLHGSSTFLNPLSTTVYTIITTDANNCSASNTVSVNHYSSSTPVISQAGNTLSIASNTNSLQWYGNNVLLAGETGSSLTLTQGGLYYLVSTDAAGCIDTSNIINVLFTDINTLSFENSMEVFPNPASGEIDLVWKQINSPSNLKIMDCYGKCVFEKKLELNQAQPLKVNIGYLSPGLYFIILDGKMEKFIKR